MELFFIIIAITFLLIIAVDIVKLLRISSLVVPRYTKPSSILQSDLDHAEEEYEKLNSNSSTDSYDSYGQTIRLMRAEEKLKLAKSKIMQERMAYDWKKYSAELMLGYVLKAILYVTLAIISIRNRYSPVLVLNEDINLQPLRGLLSFPTGVPNAISVPIWILSCNVTFGLFAGIIKEKRKAK